MTEINGKIIWIDAIVLGVVAIAVIVAAFIRAYYNVLRRCEFQRLEMDDIRREIIKAGVFMDEQEYQLQSCRKALEEEREKNQQLLEELKAYKQKDLSESLFDDYPGGTNR